MSKKFVLRHWRGNGQIIPSVMQDKYYDYPKHRNRRPYSLAECIYKVITFEEYKEEVLKMWGEETLTKLLKRYKLS